MSDFHQEKNDRSGLAKVQVSSVFPDQIVHC